MACFPSGRRLLALAVLVVLPGALACGAPRADRDVREPRRAVRPAAWVDALNAGVRVLHVAPGRDRARVRVAWTNRTGRGYRNALEIQCIARAPDGRFLGSEVGDFLPRREPLARGFRGELALELPVGGARLGSVSCAVTEAR